MVLCNSWPNAQGVDIYSITCLGQQVLHGLIIIEIYTVSDVGFYSRHFKTRVGLWVGCVGVMRENGSELWINDLCA